MNLFRPLTQKEDGEFRKWAWDNYEPLSDINGLWHPVVQEECARINSLQIFPEETILISD